MSEAVAVLNVMMMMTSILSEESLARDRHKDTLTLQHGFVYL